MRRPFTPFSEAHKINNNTTTSKMKNKSLKIKKLSPDMAKINWNIAAPGIRCRADWYGASVYEITKDGDSTRVLAYTENDAISTFENADFQEIIQPHPTLI